MIEVDELNRIHGKSNAIKKNGNTARGEFIDCESSPGNVIIGNSNTGEKSYKAASCTGRDADMQKEKCSAPDVNSSNRFHKEQDQSLRVKRRPVEEETSEPMLTVKHSQLSYNRGKIFPECTINYKLILPMNRKHLFNILEKTSTTLSCGRPLRPQKSPAINVHMPEGQKLQFHTIFHIFNNKNPGSKCVTCSSFTDRKYPKIPKIKILKISLDIDLKMIFSEYYVPMLKTMHMR